MARPALTKQQLYERFPDVEPDAINVKLYDLSDLRLVYLFDDTVELTPLGQAWWETNKGEAGK